MSAWMLSNRHVNALVEGAIRLGIVEPNEATKTGRMLQRANVKSMRARYGETRKELGVVTFNYHTPKEPVDDVTLFKAAACFDYQACEYDSYDRSPAYRLIMRIERTLEARGINRDSPGYQDSPWGIW